MSRARPVAGFWFDTKRNGEKAKAEHIELLVAVERLDLDDFLDEHPSQGEVIERLRNALGENGIPDDVLERREQWRQERLILPKCRICGEEGNSTKHHFVNKWILKELNEYSWRWADRRYNCIPVCIKCHRNLHLRSSGPASVVEYLTDKERAFAQAALTALSEQQPKLLIFIACGDDSVYESRLIKDWIHGKFRPTEPEQIVPAKLLEKVA